MRYLQKKKNYVLFVRYQSRCRWTAEPTKSFSISLIISGHRRTNFSTWLTFLTLLHYIYLCVCFLVRMCLCVPAAGVVCSSHEKRIIFCATLYKMAYFWLIFTIFAEKRMLRTIYVENFMPQWLYKTKKKKGKFFFFLLICYSFIYLAQWKRERKKKSRCPKCACARIFLAYTSYDVMIAIALRRSPYIHHRDRDLYDIYLLLLSIVCASPLLGWELVHPRKSFS